jgi:hypothetical protein
MRLLSETKARKEVDELVGRYVWDDLGNADRGIYATADFVPIAVDLEPLRPAAEMQLNRQQPAPAASLKAVLKERKLRAEEGTKSNDFTKGIKMCQELQRPVVLVDRRITGLHWPGDGLSQPRNYLDWPASSLQPLVGQTDPDSDDFLVAALCQVFAEQDRNRVKRDAKVALAIQMRDDQELTVKSKAHPDLFPPRLQGDDADRLHSR